MAAVRDELIRHAAPHLRDGLREELEALGPSGLWIDLARDFLADHGFVQAPRESLAETMARALDISTEELRTLMAQGKIGTALRERFPEAKPS